MTKTLTIKAENYRRFLKARRLASAITRLADSLKKDFGLPEANENTVGEYSILDGNGQAIGKLTISPKDAYLVKASFVSRLS